MNGLVPIMQCLVRLGHWCISSRVVSPAMLYDLLASSSHVYYIRVSGCVSNKVSIIYLHAE